VADLGQGLVTLEGMKSGEITYRCPQPNQLLLGQLSSNPYLPWPGYTEGTSKELVSALEQLQAESEQVGIIQSLLVTCKLHGVNPYEYIVDVLLRIVTHPASRVIELTPRVWKEIFADNPLRSDLAAKRLTS
jgi:hypothetical protein